MNTLEVLEQAMAEAREEGRVEGFNQAREAAARVCDEERQKDFPDLRTARDSIRALKSQEQSNG